MEHRYLTVDQMKAFAMYLRQAEKSEATIEKYLRDVGAFCRFADGREVTKELVMAWKRALVEQGYAVRSINSMLASVNSLLAFHGWHECRVKNIRLQRQTYAQRSGN